MIAFKVKIDLSGAYSVLNLLGLGDITKKPYWIKVNAYDPDDACVKARKKVGNTIQNTFEALEISGSRIIDASKKATKEMKILKIEVEEYEE
tara:strand:+ start:56 stop:331 length:276 start_codon:yes stop_codon:yes gene_type:complete